MEWSYFLYCFVSSYLCSFFLNNFSCWFLLWLNSNQIGIFLVLIETWCVYYDMTKFEENLMCCLENVYSLCVGSNIVCVYTHTHAQAHTYVKSSWLLVCFSRKVLCLLLVWKTSLNYSRVSKFPSITISRSMCSFVLLCLLVVCFFFKH